MFPLKYEFNQFCMSLSRFKLQRLGANNANKMQTIETTSTNLKHETSAKNEAKTDTRKTNECSGRMRGMKLE